MATPRIPPPGLCCHIDRDYSFAEDNTEHGRAWTLAWFFEPRTAVRLGAEFASVSARRIAAAEGIRSEH